MFFQYFIHSGMNPYLTLQIAYSYLFAGNRVKFNETLNTVNNSASPTNTFPETNHPFTNGGSMGDGHHGWAASENVLVAADSFAFEQNNNIYILAGIPENWFTDGNEFYIKKLKFDSGEISINCSITQNINNSLQQTS